MPRSRVQSYTWGIKTQGARARAHKEKERASARTRAKQTSPVLRRASNARRAIRELRELCAARPLSRYICRRP